jgi:putative tricarboxylic transport membrane protein
VDGRAVARCEVRGRHRHGDLLRGGARSSGFFITAFIFLGTLCFAFGVPRKHIMPIAIGVPFVIHYAFYTLLRVPLPWGLLERLAW